MGGGSGAGCVVVLAAEFVVFGCVAVLHNCVVHISINLFLFLVQFYSVKRPQK